MLQRNSKQIAILQAILNNTADFCRHGNTTGYERGFTATGVLGRASGKTYTIFDVIAIAAKEMPGCCIALGARTYAQVQTIVLQQMAKVFKEHGLYEYDKYNPFGQYVVFAKPPSNWLKPNFPSRDFTRVISFCNGSYAILASADRPETLRGGNWDVRILDESGSCSEDFATTTDPSIRANKYTYKDPRPGRQGLNHPLHWLRLDFTSQPRTPKGQWIFRTEENMKDDPTGYFYIEGNAYDNIQNLPGSYVEDLRKKMNDIDFRIEVLNERIVTIANAFYPAFRPSEHCQLDNTYKYNADTGIYDQCDNSYDTLKEVILGLDFNSYFTSLLVAQHHLHSFNFVDCMYVKEANKTLVEQLIDNFIDKYSSHIKKIIRLRGDQSGNRRYENSTESSWAIIKRKLRLAGWEVIDEVQSNYPSFSERYLILNSLLNHENKLLPKITIHETNCKSLILALQLAPTKGDNYEKDKSSEKSKSVAQENATHLTDIFDYILIKSFGNYVVSSGRGGVAFINS